MLSGNGALVSSLGFFLKLSMRGEGILRLRRSSSNKPQAIARTVDSLLFGKNKNIREYANYSKEV